MAFRYTNLSGGMVHFALDHRNFCGTGPCSCSTSKGAKLNYKNGMVVAANVQPIRHPMVITLLKGQTSEPLPNSSRQCEEVKALMASKPPKLKAEEGEWKPEEEVSPEAGAPATPLEPLSKRRRIQSEV